MSEFVKYFQPANVSGSCPVWCLLHTDCDWLHIQMFNKPEDVIIPNKSLDAIMIRYIVIDNSFVLVMNSSPLTMNQWSIFYSIFKMFSYFFWLRCGQWIVEQDLSDFYRGSCMTLRCMIWFNVTMFYAASKTVKEMSSSEFYIFYKYNDLYHKNIINRDKSVHGLQQT